MNKNLFLFFLSLVLFSCNTGIENNSLDEESGITDKRELITLKSGVVVEKIGDSYYYSGDIEVYGDQLKRLDETGSIYYDPEEMEAITPENGISLDPTTGMMTYYEEPMTKAVGKSPNNNMFWSMLRYTYGNSLSPNQKTAIAYAIKYIESLTNVRFYNATGEPTRARSELWI